MEHRYFLVLAALDIYNLSYYLHLVISKLVINWYNRKSIPSSIIHPNEFKNIL